MNKVERGMFLKTLSKDDLVSIIGRLEQENELIREEINRVEAIKVNLLKEQGYII